MIGESEAEAAQVEVSRRLLAAADAEASAPQAAPPAATSRPPAHGCDRGAGHAAARRKARFIWNLARPCCRPNWSAAREANASIETMVAQVDDHLAKNPSDGRGWELIAPVYLKLGRFRDAIKARRNAIALNGETAERYAGLGGRSPRPKAVSSARGQGCLRTSRQARRRERAGALLPGHRGRTGRPACRRRRDLARHARDGAPADAPWADFIRSEIARLEGGPGEEDVAAAAEPQSPSREPS